MPAAVPGSPAAVLSAVLRASASHPYSAADPTQHRMAVFSSTAAPDLPSLITDVVFMPAYSELDANVAITGWLASQGWGTQGVTTVTAAYTAASSDAVILANALSGAITITLPDVTQPGFVNPGQRYTIIKTDSSSNAVTITGTNGQLISGASSMTLSNANAYSSVIFDGANWQTWAGYTTVGTSPSGSAGGDLGSNYPNPTVTGTHLASALPIAQGGTGTATGATQNDVFAGPSTGGAGAPAFRALVTGDLPAGVALLSGAAFSGNVSTTGTLGASDAVTAGVVTITYASTITPNASLGNHFRCTLTGNVTLAAPTSPTDGQKITVELIQDSSGSHTLTLSGIGLGTDISSVTLTTTPSKRDFLALLYSSSSSTWYVVGVVHGY